MNVTIKPGRLSGSAAAPPSKSYAHRLMICSALAEGGSVVRGISGSRDMLATMDCISALGAKFRLDEGTLYIEGTYPEFVPGTEFPCFESGSTLRFFIPIAAICGKEARFTGTQRLIERGVSVYEGLFPEKNIDIIKEKESITIKGRLPAGYYQVPGNISSQFISGLLFALPLAEGDSEVDIIPPVESRPYIDITVDAVRSFGIQIKETAAGHFVIPGGQRYRAQDVTVEGDWSNAAALLALNSAGSEIKVTGLNQQSIQGDKACVEFLKRLSDKDPVIDLSDSPDLGPVLFAAAAVRGGAVFTGTKRLRIKESDRAAAMACELAKFGIRAEVGENSVVIHGGTLSRPAEVLSSHNDHRIVMALTVLCSAAGGEITEAEAVRKSWPDFFEVMKTLGMEVSLDT